MELLLATNQKQYGTLYENVFGTSHIVEDSKLPETFIKRVNEYLVGLDYNTLRANFFRQEINGKLAVGIKIYGDGPELTHFKLRYL